MAFWKFGFHSQSAIDSILSSSTANQHHANPNAGCSTPSFSNPSLLLDKLLEEDDLLQEIKAQHPKLVEFLGTREVVSRILGYVSGLIFDDEEADRLAEHSNSSLNRLSSNHPSAPASASASSAASSTSPQSPQGPSAVMGYGGALFNSFRTRVVNDTIGALLMDALDSEGRTPEDRAKAERRKIRYPYLCTEILASDLWSVTSQIFSDFPRLNLLTRFWDAVLDQPPSATASKSVQIGYWAKANITLINSKPSEMMSFIRSYPNLIPKLLAHFNSSPIVDVLMRIIQSEQTTDGTIDWLIDSTDFVELIISLLHPSRTPDLHRSVAEFLKDVIAFCTNHVISTSPSPNLPNKVSNGSLPGAEGGPTSSPDLARPVPGPSIQQSSNDSEDHPKFITTRLMRELSSSAVVSKLLSFGLDTPVSEDDGVITNTSLASSLINSLSVVIDLIRRNNSDYSEHQLMVYLRDYPPAPGGEEEGEPSEEGHEKPLSDSAPRVVPLIGLLNAIGDRLGDLQMLIKSPRSATKPLQTVVGMSVPLTQERFRLIELYAELLHCSNMALVNRLDSEPRPRYNKDGALVSGLDALVAIFGPSNDELLSKPSSDAPPTVVDSEELASAASHPSSPEVPVNLTMATTADSEELSEKAEQPSASVASSPENSSPEKFSPEKSSPEESVPSPAETSPTEGGSGIPAGVRMKELFLKHKVLDSCFDLFFAFPWNNFLHNVIYDLVQQSLNAKFSRLQPSGLASLKLAQSFFEDTRIVDRLLDGVDANHLYQMKAKNGRLGNMGHLILIGDEVLKAVENNPEEFESILEELEKNERWTAFLNGPIHEAREHAKLPLGGVMPVIGGGMIEAPLMPATDEVESSLIAASTGNSTSSITPPIQEESPVSIEERTGLGSSGGNGKGKKVRQGRTKKDGEEEGSDEDEMMSVQSTRKAPPGLLHRFQEPKQQTDYGDDDCWDSSRHSDPSSFRSSLLSNPNSPAFHQMSSSSVISNPTPFGFDDRFDAPTRSFPQSFQDHSNLDESDDRGPGEGGGFDDDFGGLGEVDRRGITSQASARGTPRPQQAQPSSERSPAQNLQQSLSITGGTGGGVQTLKQEQEEEEEWGEFAGPTPAITLTPSTNLLDSKADDENQWNDFDLLVDQTHSMSLTDPTPSSSSITHNTTTTTPDPSSSS
ncbi:hypothetical protein PGT21_024383 [Puccinia graminis f. sp. tritici]|uniref:Extragenic suppressor of kinetochore protein 1 n=1 Tax=Puccinia graminis f. sp. tritici TaxID=56615 RepID=A0A5B0LXP2_PUCGR|nr:hypothetical protein PGTUg99_024120 [Puccinia graminis f. sp. tritici]KAA1104461.1 hypothetical protein PGT21_024383 [Puccinia graminis f. sp. tritici]